MKLRVLSLFDGCACGYVALKRAGFEVDVYYRSEIDKYANIIANKNHPDVVNLGDVRNIRGSDLGRIDLLIGGSPCQGFSVAGGRLNFEHKESKLFFEYVRLMRECNPKYFLLENVMMKPEWVATISDYLGVQPVKIDSALVQCANSPTVILG